MNEVRIKMQSVGGKNIDKRNERDSKTARQRER